MTLSCSRPTITGCPAVVGSRCDFPDPPAHLPLRKKRGNRSRFICCSEQQEGTEDGLMHFSVEHTVSSAVQCRAVQRPLHSSTIHATSASSSRPRRLRTAALALSTACNRRCVSSMRSPGQPQYQKRTATCRRSPLIGSRLPARWS